MVDYPILILHGWNLYGEKFKPLVVEFKKRGYDAEAIDLPGFGKATIPQKPLVLTDYVDFVEKYIKGKRWEGIFLIGHSFGGRIGIKLASKNPSYLKALILSGAPGFNPVPQKRILLFLTLAKIGSSIFALPILKYFQTLARQFLYKAAQASDFYNTDPKMRATFKNIVKEDLSIYMSKINIPTLLIWGVNDLIVPLDIAKKMNKIISSSQLEIIPAARHGVPWTHSKLFADKISNFLKNYVY